MLLQLSKTVKQSPKSPQIFENNGTFCADRPFSKNRSETNCQKSFVFNQLVSERFNRTSFQQQLKPLLFPGVNAAELASIVHPFNNNWNPFLRHGLGYWNLASIVHPFNNNWNWTAVRASISTPVASIVHPFNNNWNAVIELNRVALMNSRTRANGVLSGANAWKILSFTD